MRALYFLFSHLKESRLKYLYVAFSVLLLASCKSTNLPIYTEVESNNKAQLTISANLKGLFLHGRVTQMEIFEGCYNDDYDKENVLGHVISDHSGDATNTVSLPANKELFFQFGTTEPSWNCHVQFSFTPENGKAYFLNYDMVFGGCETSLKESVGEQVVNVRYFDTGSGTSKVWRRCDKI